jgi:hypothetical protein
MAEEQQELITGEQLHKKLEEVLETWPLYRRLEYKGAENFDKLPADIWLYCRVCDGLQRWTRETPGVRIRAVGAPTVVTHRGGDFRTVSYHCANCKPSSRLVTRFFFFWGWNAEQKSGSFLKAGQFPPPDERVPTTLENRLDKDDLELYKNAIRLRNHNLGIGAVAYLRRVVENRINDLLDVLADIAREQSFAAEELCEVEKVKKSHRFDDKIDYAAKLLPPHLKPKGMPNPIDKLHELTSDGLHSKTEAECVEIFDRVRTVFEYVFGNLHGATEAAKEFVRSLGGLVSSPQEKAAKKVAPEEEL